MDKQKLIDTIKGAGLSAENQALLLEMVEKAPQADDRLVADLRKKLAEIGDALAEAVTNRQIQEASEDFQKEMDAINQDVNKLNREISKKADEVDLQAAKAALK